MHKILILTNNDFGLYKFRKELIQKLIYRGNSVSISLPLGSYVSKLVDLGCEYIETNFDRRNTNPISDLFLLRFYIKMLNRLKPDLVLTYTIKPNVYGGLACQLKSIPYIANITGLGTSIENKSLIKNISLNLYKSGLKSARCVFFQNQDNHKYFRENQILQSKTRIIPGSGVNLNLHKYEEYPGSEEKIRLLYIGRMMKAKGTDELLEVANRMMMRFPEVHFDLVGEPEEEYLYRAEKSECVVRLFFHGRQDNVHEFIKNSHAIIHPSHHEGMSNVLLEAASTGRPVLASNIPGCRETFDEGTSGFGFEPKNVNSMVETITKFIELPHEAKKKMGLAGRRKMEREYDRQIVIDAYMEEVDTILNQHKGDPNELI